MLEQMHEIMRMREQQRNNMRLIRQREQQALRDFERVRANRVLGQQAPVVGGHINNINLPPQHPLPAAAPFPGAVYGNPQAVPEPLPFLEVVENHGRNIHIVQQQRMPFIAGPAAQPLPPVQHHVAQQQPAAAVHRARHHLAAARGAALPPNNHHHHQDRVHHRHGAGGQDAVAVSQRERERRSREEAIVRLRRNREEVLRRQRRHGHDHREHREHRHQRHHHHHHGEVRVERVPNNYPTPAAGEAEKNPGDKHRETQ